MIFFHLKLFLKLVLNVLLIVSRLVLKQPSNLFLNLFLISMSCTHSLPGDLMVAPQDVNAAVHHAHATHWPKQKE